MDCFYYFIPVFAILFIFTGFWMFLYHGYQQIYEKDKFYIVLMNLLIFDLITVFIYFKISKIMVILSWFNILGIISLVNGFNFLYFFLQSMDGKHRPVLNNVENESWESYLTLMNIVLNVSVILFFPMMGLYLDDCLKKARENFLFMLVWLSLIILIVKFYDRNQKIKEFCEWKKATIA